LNDIRPPAGAVGHAFGLDQAGQRAPYPVSSNMLRRAVEYGKESARDQGKWLRMFLYGAGLVVGVLVVFGILYIIGASVLSGGGGGGVSGAASATDLGTLLLVGSTASSALRRRVQNLVNWIRTHPKLAGAVFVEQFGELWFRGTITLTVTLNFAMMVVLMGDLFTRHPDLATEQVRWLGRMVPMSAFLSDVFNATAVALVLAYPAWVIGQTAGDYVERQQKKSEGGA